MRGVNPPPTVLTWTLDEAAPASSPTGSCRLPRKHPFLRGLTRGARIWVIQPEGEGAGGFPWLQSPGS